MFARRAAWDLAASPLAALLADRKKRGLPLLDLSESNPTRVGIEAPGAALARALAEHAEDASIRRYEPDPRGEPRARAAVAAHHATPAESVSPEQVILTAGTSEGYAHLFRLLGDPGDRVHVPRPGYPLFEHLAALEGLAVEHYALRPPARAGLGPAPSEAQPSEAAQGPPPPKRPTGLVPRSEAQPSEAARWRIDFETLHAGLDARSRAVLVIHPHNPTGSFLDPEDLEALRALARERGLALISDEVFGGTAATDPPPPSLLAGAEAGPLHFVLAGASKRLALPQLKLAWIVVAGPAAAREEALARLEFIADAYLSVSPLLARVLPDLLARERELTRPIRERVAENRARLARLGAAGPVTALPSEAGWAAILRVEGPRDEEALALELLERAGVFVQPGFWFDLAEEAGAAHLVVSLLPEPERFERGLDALVAFAAALA